MARVPEEANQTADEQPATASGPGRVLIAIYAIFAVGATSRAAVQIATRFDEAPFPYVLSAFAAVVYLLATFALARKGIGWWRVALAACSVELAGVLIVGTLSVFDTAAFPDAAVWSNFGMGYLFIPLVLPVVGLLWLRKTHPSTAAGITRTPR
ncbi:hypothetical protein SAMN05421630_10677 [Prauserella marina]|uniref:Uncharacterized protein n=1 Tax=Prauserella marina TaxID=530584 RepID=A0A1G6SBY3_9PSEU|nr:hypothetical protein DES30_10277 [Prauserella marina]SDD13635.1 hypothetical protein SAMN05421630_10677 [Prauserella marina]